jgi:hypothetical protein
MVFYSLRLQGSLNAGHLSRELATEKNEERRAELIEAVATVGSPPGQLATWKHFLHGEFDFLDERMSTR